MTHGIHEIARMLTCQQLDIPRSALQSWVHKAQKGRMRDYDTVIKDKAISDFSSGIGVMALSRKYEIPKSTLQGWIKKAVHHHIFLIDTPNGPQSKGTCTICKEERYFNNSIEHSGWAMSRPKDQDGVEQTNGAESTTNEE